MHDEYDQLSGIDPSERVLLLSHCLRPSASCPGKFTKSGLQCSEDCGEDCVVGRLVRAARSFGYRGVCIAPGGKMAVRFVAENEPKAIVAVACERELAEGVEAVRDMAASGREMPVVLVVPLSKDGCVDTEVNENEAMEALAAGCCAAI